MEMQLTGNGQRWSRRIAADIPVQVAIDGSPTIDGHLKNPRRCAADCRRVGRRSINPVLFPVNRRPSSQLLVKSSQGQV